MTEPSKVQSIGCEPASVAAEERCEEICNEIQAEDPDLCQGNPDCFQPADQLSPKVAAALLRKITEKIRQDKSIAGTMLNCGVDMAKGMFAAIKPDVKVADVPYVAQNFDGSFPCRKACLSMVRKYLTSALPKEEVKKGVVDKVVPQDIYNQDKDHLKLTVDNYPANNDKISPKPELTKEAIGVIDRHLDNNCPAIVYVKHATGSHVVTVTERTKLPDGKYEYKFQDPGSGGEARFSSLIYDPATGKCSRDGKQDGPVGGRELTLLGAYDYQSKLAEASPTATSAPDISRRA